MMKTSDWSLLTGPAVRQNPLVILGQDLVTCVQQRLVITLSLNIYKTSGVINKPLQGMAPPLNE